MTPRQKDMLDAIRDLTVDGVSPTYEQLRVHLGIASKSGVNRMIVALERLGHVRRLKGCRRTVEIISPDAATRKRPDTVAGLVCEAVWARSAAGQKVTRPDLYDIVLEALR